MAHHKINEASHGIPHLWVHWSLWTCTIPCLVHASANGKHDAHPTYKYLIPLVSTSIKSLTRRINIVVSVMKMKPVLAIQKVSIFLWVPNMASCTLTKPKHAIWRECLSSNPKIWNVAKTSNCKEFAFYLSANGCQAFVMFSWHTCKAYVMFSWKAPKKHKTVIVCKCTIDAMRRKFLPTLYL